MTILHDRNLAVLSASRIMALDQGRLAASGMPVQSVTDDIIHQVFGATKAVNHVPGPDAPFVLPHRARRMLP